MKRHAEEISDEETELNMDFKFEDDQGEIKHSSASDFDSFKCMMNSSKNAKTTVEDKISKILGSGDNDNVEKEEEDDDQILIEEHNNSEFEIEVPDKILEKKKAEFFEREDEVPGKQQLITDFCQINLSRPLLKALSELKFTKPTQIQSLALPIGLAGKDICGSATTGSGKTAAFLIPIIERLLHRPGKAELRVVILTPTRELAAQIHSVAMKLAKFTDISFCLCTGGLSSKMQEIQLKKRPDVVIATPGRLIDHVRNTNSFGLDSIEILVMDEADRMLEDGFKEELTEIIKSCPRKRQTLLFSATMTDDVDSLISLSLNKPVRLFVDPNTAITSNLVQEFIKIKNVDSNDLQKMNLLREAIVLALCKRTFKDRVIIFLPSKMECHRMRIIFALSGLSCCELHGNLTQAERIDSLEKFRDGKYSILLATDLAARGLDIAGIQTVINFQMPTAYDRYVHRVGRTARNNEHGKSVTLVSESERKSFKVVLKNLKNGQSLKQRIVPLEIIEKYKKIIINLGEKISSVLKMENDEKSMLEVERYLKKAENMIIHENEILSRPAKTWFQKKKQKNKKK
jgi:ATP-dependent RNA helicase DDX27